MKKEIYIAAATGDEEFLRDARATDVEATVAAYSDADLLGLTSYGDNIIHVAAQNGHLGFIKSALEWFSASPAAQTKLISGTNEDGDTPLHLASKQPASTIAHHLVTFHEQLLLQPNTDDNEIAVATTTAAPSSSLKLWRLQNNKGNTPLHVALMNGAKGIQVAAYLLRIGPEVASYANHRKETPLHLAVDYDDEGAKLSKKNAINKLNSLGASLNYTECIFEENSLSMIKLLVETSTTACCLRDEYGKTPLHRATFNQHLSAVEAIIDYCPEAVKMCCPSGRTVLHCTSWPNYFKLLKMPGISALIDQQDEDGNTPLHIAITSSNCNMIKALTKYNADFATKNKEGASPATLILLDSSSFLDKLKDDIEQSYPLEYESMNEELHEASANMNWEYLLERLEAAETDDKHFVSQQPSGCNIIHRALNCCKHDYDGEYFDCSNDEERYSSLHEEFIVEALKKFPILSCQTDNLGDTPLHDAMYRSILKPRGRGFQTVVDHLIHFKHQPSCFPIAPWEAKNYEGNNLLHSALRCDKYEFAEKLLELDSELAGKINHNMETPLHVLCRHSDTWGRHGEKVNDIVDLLLDKHPKAVYSYDADGFTPLLRAVKAKRLEIATRILHLHPGSINSFHSLTNRSIFHLMDLDAQRYINHREFSNNLPRDMVFFNYQDCKGNTPLQHAIKHDRFGTAQILMELNGKDLGMYRLRNNDGESGTDVLAKAQEVPRKFQDFIMSDPLNLGIDTGNSMYGVRYTSMKEYMGTVGVVAALLTTITFTAAFTIPGGYDQNKGTPMMARKVAFQVFMVADVMGMCSSMMVLFCLLWFLNSGQVRKEGARLVDLSIFLLQISFYSTLIAFMTGVYVTTIPDIRWLATFTCVFCGIVLVLMRKRFILDFVAFWLLYPVVLSRKWRPTFRNRDRLVSEN